MSEYKETMPQRNDNQTQKLQILCFDLTHLNRTTQFFISSGGVFSLYLLYGYMQELIFTLEGFKPYGWFLTLIQFFYYIGFGLLERQIEVFHGAGSLTKRFIPMKTYVILALLTLGTMGLSNSSLGYLNYPTQVIFKCCKLIPVLIGSIIIQGKRYGPLDFAAAAAMSLGLISFTLTDSEISPNFNTFGVLLISLSLLCDAAIGNVQEKAMREKHAPSSEVVLYSYGLGFVYLLFVMVLSGNFMPGLRFCLKYPRETFGYAMLFSLSGYLGIQFVLALVRSHGAPVAATVTTARKAVSISVSFVFFEKPFNIQYVLSSLLVVFGIFLNVYSKKLKLSVNDVRDKILHWMRATTSKNYNDKKFVAEV